MCWPSSTIPVSYPNAGDLAIKRDLLCAMAHARLGQAQQADSELAGGAASLRCEPLRPERRGPKDGSVVKTTVAI